MWHEHGGSCMRRHVEGDGNGARSGPTRSVQTTVTFARLELSIAQLSGTQRNNQQNIIKR